MPVVQAGGLKIAFRRKRVLPVYRRFPECLRFLNQKTTKEIAAWTICRQNV